MGLRVNTNMASLNAQRNLMNTTNQLGRSMEKLSSGLRITRASDDAAGLAICYAYATFGAGTNPTDTGGCSSSLAGLLACE